MCYFHFEWTRAQSTEKPMPSLLRGCLIFFPFFNTVPSSKLCFSPTKCTSLLLWYSHTSFAQLAAGWCRGPTGKSGSSSCTWYPFCVHCIFNNYILDFTSPSLLNKITIIKIFKNHFYHSSAPPSSAFLLDTKEHRLRCRTMSLLRTWLHRKEWLMSLALLESLWQMKVRSHSLLPIKLIKLRLPASIIFSFSFSFSPLPPLLIPMKRGHPEPRFRHHPEPPFEFELCC